MKYRRLLALVGFPSLLAALFLVAFLLRHQLSAIFSSPEALKNWITAAGLRASLVFILLQAVQVIVFFIPGEVPQIAAGFLFGFWIGSLLSVLGITLGSLVSFFASRLLGVPFIYALFKPEKVNKIRRITHSPRAKLSLFLFFLIPGIPKDILCYVAGLSPLKPHVFLVLSLLGRLPGIAGSALMGEAAFSRRWLLAGAILALSTLLFLLGFLFKGKIQEFLVRFSQKMRRQ